MVLEESPQIPISEEVFKQLQLAKSILSAAFAIEEKYDLLIANYIELEKELISISIANTVQNARQYKQFFDIRAGINRRAVNLLTACRLYLDQIPQHLKECLQGESSVHDDLKNLLSTQYDESAAYRFLEALRNHVQHCGLAVYGLSIDSEWATFKNEELLSTVVAPYIEKRYLVDDKKFKKAVLLEIADKVDLMSFVREYIQRLGAVHKYVRDKVAHSTLKARNLVNGKIELYSQASSGETIGLNAISNDGVEDTTFFPLFLDWDDVRLQLIDRNTTAVNLSRRFVSSRILNL